MQEPEKHELGRIYFPSSPSEFITVFAHFHRAEIAQSNVVIGRIRNGNRLGFRPDHPVAGNLGHGNGLSRGREQQLAPDAYRRIYASDDVRASPPRKWRARGRPSRSADSTHGTTAHVKRKSCARGA